MAIFGDFVVRGDTPITNEDDLKSALAMALRLENVGVLLGAGASIGAGGRSIAEIWQKIEKDHATTAKFLADEGFRNGEETNVEAILGRLGLAQIDATRRSDSTTKLNAAVSAMVREITSAAVLNIDLWSNPDAAIEWPKLQSHRQLVTRLLAGRQPGQAAPTIFTTNYDLAIEWAAELIGVHVVNGFTGLHSRLFDPSALDLSLRNTTARGEARFGAYDISLIKLHGSLSWREENGKVFEQQSASIQPAISSFLSNSNDAFKPLLVYPTAAKYVDTIGFVYGEMMRRFSEFMARPNCCLLTCGYGFNDEHINRLIASGLRNPTMMFVAYYPEWDTDGPIRNKFLERVRQIGSTRVIIRGGGASAHMDQFVSNLPDPTLIDETSDIIRKFTKLLGGSGSAA